MSASSKRNRRGKGGGGGVSSGVVSVHTFQPPILNATRQNELEPQLGCVKIVAGNDGPLLRSPAASAAGAAGAAVQCSKQV